MPITHAFVNPKADGGDATITRPSDWNAAHIGARDLLAADRTYYVRTDGSNSNSGLVNNAAGAFLTVQKGVDTALSLDLGIFNVTISVQPGTYTSQVSVFGPPVGSGTIKISGDTTTPSNVIFSVVSSHCINMAYGATLSIEGIKFINSTAGNCITMDLHSILNVTGKIEFGSCTGGSHMNIDNGSIISFTYGTAYLISGGTINGHFIATDNSSITLSGCTCIVTGVINFPIFAQASVGGIANCFGITYDTSGATVTGKRYDANLNGVIQTGGGGANVFPGNSAGTNTTGGQYA